MLPESNLQGGERERVRAEKRNRDREGGEKGKRRERVSDYPRKKAWYWFCVHVEVAAH